MDFSSTHSVEIQVVEVEVECRSVASSRRSKGSRRSNNSRRRRSRGGSGDNEEGSNPYLFFSREATGIEVDEDGFAIPSSRPSTSKAKSVSSSAYRPKSLFSCSASGTPAGSGAPYRKAASGPQNKKLRKKLSTSSDDGNSSDSAAECGWQAFCAQSLAKRRGHQSMSPCQSSGGESGSSAAALRSERRLSPMPSPSLLPTIELLPGATNVVIETDLCAFFLEGCA
jgi:hypothetical protein